ncbi:hypothetical protein AMAG_00182 [Allomyces macrogynus ATCC 38327]|uniref:Uncharacterized protein n=1 Tax=Allomyces macrogynus (strain ATCC 38327) TaxID=578462 RepID=A0A0L0RUV0_ALLM3|nr:hypothetical protein AMAG_00182 [Allomyces macrogynus ATCC 38327]|eukprot:KNE54187.1 hypothetical protein AMAG_00182 [Allomyces macrogynus ATCC 38327]
MKRESSSSATSEESTRGDARTLAAICSNSTLTSNTDYPMIRAPIERLPYDVVEITSQWVLAGTISDRTALLHLAISSPMFFAPAVHTAIRHRRRNIPFIASGQNCSVASEDAWPWTKSVAAQTGGFVADIKAPSNLAWTWRLILPTRTFGRIYVPLNERRPGELNWISCKWTTVHVPETQLVRYTSNVTNQDLPVPRTCQYLTLCRADWEKPNVLPMYLNALVTLELLYIDLDDAARQQSLASLSALRSLIVRFGLIKDSHVLRSFYQQLPPTLVTLKLSFDEDDYPNDTGRRLVAGSLTSSLQQMKQLQVFSHDYLRVEDLALVIDALTLRSGSSDPAPMRSLHLVLAFPNTAPLVENRDKPRTVLTVSHLDCAIHECEQPRIGDERVGKALAMLPVPTQSLHLSLSEWTDSLANVMLNKLVTTTLRDIKLSLINDLDALGPYSSVHSILSLVALDPARKSPGIASLALTNCPLGRMMPDAIKEGWAMPSTLTSLRLSDNGLTTDDLAMLQPLLPPNLQHLDISKNKFCSLIVPLPSKLHTLNIAGNPGLSEDMNPGKWITSLPSTLRRLDIRLCNFNDKVGRMLIAARRRAGRMRAGWPKQEMVVDQHRNVVYPINRFSDEVYQALCGRNLE